MERVKAQSEVIVTDDELPAEVMRAVVDGRKIEAIKILQESTGLGLANAKVLVDRASRLHGPKKPDHSGFVVTPNMVKTVFTMIGIGVLVWAWYTYLR